MSILPLNTKKLFLVPLAVSLFLSQNLYGSDYFTNLSKADEPTDFSYRQRQNQEALAEALIALKTENPDPRVKRKEFLALAKNGWRVATAKKPGLKETFGDQYTEFMNRGEVNNYELNIFFKDLAFAFDKLNEVDEEAYEGSPAAYFEGTVAAIEHQPNAWFIPVLATRPYMRIPVMAKAGRHHITLSGYPVGDNLYHHGFPASMKSFASHDYGHNLGFLDLGVRMMGILSPLLDMADETCDDHLHTASFWPWHEEEYFQEEQLSQFERYFAESNISSLSEKLEYLFGFKKADGLPGPMRTFMIPIKGTPEHDEEVFLHCLRMSPKFRQSGLKETDLTGYTVEDESENSSKVTFNFKGEKSLSIDGVKFKSISKSIEGQNDEIKLLEMMGAKFSNKYSLVPVKEEKSGGASIECLRLQTQNPDAMAQEINNYFKTLIFDYVLEKARELEEQKIIGGPLNSNN